MAVRIWGGDPMLKVMVDETRFMIGLLDPAHAETASCRDWLQEAEDALNERVLGCFLPYHAYDKIWALLNRIRHLLCRLLPADRLLPLLVQLRDGLGYIVWEGDRKEYFARLLEMEQALAALASPPPAPPTPSLSLDELRYQLERISRLVAGARESHWRKVNMLRTRLITTAFILVALLLASILLIPTLADNRCIHPQNLLVIAAFGAIGGLVSALRTMESLETPASLYYLQRTLLCLRPVVGAAAGVIIYLVQISGILTFVSSSSCPQASHLALAFVAGFSERFFVAQIEKIAGEAGKAAEADKTKVSSADPS